MRRLKPFALGTAPLLCAAFIAGKPFSAAADYPGQLWSVERVQVGVGSNAQDLIPAIRSGLRQANEVYFFGEQPVRMKVEPVDGADKMVAVRITDSATGALLARSPAIDAGKGSEAVRHAALAWMEGLNCGGTGCAGAPSAAPEIRIARAVAKIAPVSNGSTEAIEPQVETALALAPATLPKTSSAEAEDRIVAGIPVPARKPGTGEVSADPVRKARQRLDGANLAAVNWPVTARALQISLPALRGTGALTYSDTDNLVTDQPDTLARVAPTRQPVPTEPLKPVAVAARPERPAPSLLGRWFSSVASFLGLAGGDSDQSVSQGSTVQQSTAQPARSSAPTIAAVLTPRDQVITASDLSRSGWIRAEDAPALTNPIDRLATGRGTASTDVRLASNSQPTLPNPQVLSDAAPRQGSGQDLTQPLPRTGTSVRATTPARRTTALSVRLHPELFGRYRVAGAPSGLAGRRAVASETPAATGTVLGAASDAQPFRDVLAVRGLALDEATYSRFENIYWGGTEGEGFWISLPNRLKSDFVLVSGPNSSVISSVRRRSGIPRASDDVAKALGLEPRKWNKLRVIALRGNDATAGYSLPLNLSVRKGKLGAH
ncbi:MAG: hypothetical protein AAFP68_06935 [Pseudomonadota bacterium]